ALHEVRTELRRPAAVRHRGARLHRDAGGDLVAHEAPESVNRIVAADASTGGAVAQKAGQRDGGIEQVFDPITPYTAVRTQRCAEPTGGPVERDALLPSHEGAGGKGAQEESRGLRIRVPGMLQVRPGENGPVAVANRVAQQPAPHGVDV